MAVVLQVNLRWDAPEDQTTGTSEAAHALAVREGLIWKLWLRDADTKTSAGVYLFEDRASAESWVRDLTPPVLAEPGVSDLRTTIFEIDEAQSRITRAPLDRLAPSLAAAD